MEGVEFPEYLAEELKAFLGRCCRKPDGIEVVLDPPTPMSEVQDLPLGAASILCIDGPAAATDAQPAYLHLFVCDRKTMFKKTKRNPHAVFTGAPGIYLNVDYVGSWPDAAKKHMLTHELGHVLGLCRNTAHGDGTHCRKDVCLMHWTPDWLSQLGGMTHLYYPEHRLCEDCERDLALARQAPSDDTLSFAGPFLVRRAEGYCVASLPFYDTIILSPTPAVFDWRKALQQAKASVTYGFRKDPSKSHSRATGYGTGGVSLYDRAKEDTCAERLEQDIMVLNKAMNDPSPTIRHTAPALLKMREDALHALSRGSKPNSDAPSP